MAEAFFNDLYTDVDILQSSDCSCRILYDSIIDNNNVCAAAHFLVLLSDLKLFGLNF